MRHVPGAYAPGFMLSLASRVGTLRHDDDRMELDAIPHRNHHVAPFVLKAVVGWLEFLRGFGGKGLGRCWDSEYGKYDQNKNANISLKESCSVIQGYPHSISVKD